jgi:hypothetical protein
MGVSFFRLSGELYVNGEVYRVLGKGPRGKEMRKKPSGNPLGFDWRALEDSNSRPSDP